MKRSALALATTFLAAACSEATGPGSSPKYLLLSGVWVGSTATPGGSYVKMVTYAAAGHINGVGIAYGLMGTDTLEIGGQYSADGSFGLSIAYSSGQPAAYTGVVQGTAALTGTWTDWSTESSYNTTFTRVPVPPCSDSAPLLGSPDPAAPGFIVRFQDTVNATAETALLGGLYGFTATHVYEAAIKGFAADIPLTTVTVLRCEPKVVSIEYDGTATIAGTTPRR
jgi:hypothetical protein